MKGQMFPRLQGGSEVVDLSGFQRTDEEMPEM